MGEEQAHGTAVLIDARFTCALCGEENETTVDPSQGARQRYVEDCQVCCCANVLVVSVSDGEADVEATSEDS